MAKHLTTISLSAEAKIALAALGSFENGVQINVSPKGGICVATRFTPLVKVRSSDLSDAVMDCASECYWRAIEYAEEPFYKMRLKPLIDMLAVLPGIPRTDLAASQKAVGE
jgi:hypothetical protein